MLLQSYAGAIEIMPALPADWKDAAFNNLRAEGAVLVSAKRQNGKVIHVSLAAEKAGDFALKLPSSDLKVTMTKGARKISDDGKIIRFAVPAGGKVELTD